MSKSKDRLMLEKIFNNAAETNLYETLRDDGKNVLKDLAKYLNKPLSTICGDPVEKSLAIYTDSFEVPDMFEDDCNVAEDIITVEVVVKKGNKKLNVDVSHFNWW